MRSLGVLAVRVLGLALVAVGLVLLVSGVFASWGRIGLVYWRTFLLTVVAPPALFAVGGIVLLCLSRPLGRWLTRGLDDAGEEPAGGPARKPAFRSTSRGQRE